VVVIPKLQSEARKSRVNPIALVFAELIHSMIEVRFHRRGGQEAETGSRIVGRNGFVPHEFKPVEELLAHQGRFRHLFNPTVMTTRANPGYRG
jgi:hypothetical protein